MTEPLIARDADAPLYAGSKCMMYDMHVREKTGAGVGGSATALTEGLGGRPSAYSETCGRLSTLRPKCAPAATLPRADHFVWYLFACFVCAHLSSCALFLCLVPLFGFFAVVCSSASCGPPCFCPALGPASHRRLSYRSFFVSASALPIVVVYIFIYSCLLFALPARTRQ